MKKVIRNIIATYRHGMTVIETSPLIGFIAYGLLTYLYVSGMWEFYLRIESGKAGIAEYVVMVIMTIVILSFAFIRFVSPCSHPHVQKLRGIHGDQINHLDGARSVWLCKVCHRELYSRDLNYFDKQ